MNGLAMARVMLTGIGLMGAMAPAAPQGAATSAATAPLAVVTVKSVGGERASAYDGVVEAIRQTVVAAQVPGAVVALAVKAGDTVKAGQVLARLDARAARPGRLARFALVSCCHHAATGRGSGCWHSATRLRP